MTLTLRWRIADRRDEKSARPTACGGINNDAAYTGECRRRKYHPQSRRDAEVKKHLEDLGFVAGGTVSIVSSLGGNVIVKVKEARVAISEEMARKIMV